MEKQGDDVLLYLSGQPVIVPECNIVITQPTIKQIALFGEESFLSAVQIFTRADALIKPVRMVNPELESLSDFQILMILISQDANTRNTMETMFNLIFPDYILNITDTEIEFRIKENESIIVGMLNRMNYEAFIKTLDKLFNFHNDKDEIEYNPEGNKASEIAEKLKKGREKVKKIKSQGEEPGSLFASYVSILSIALNLDINVLLEYTPYQIYDAFLRYWAKNQSDFYQKLASTPLMDVSKMDKPKEWTRNLH